MAGPELGIAIAAIVIDGTEVVAKIVRIAVEVKHFKRACRQLLNDCIIVLEIMRRNEAKNVDLRTANRIKRSLYQCELFFRQCSEEWGVLHATLEVVFRRKHEHLKEELEWVMNLLVVDAVVRLHTSMKDKS